MDKLTRKKRIRSFRKTFALVFLVLIFGLAIGSLFLPDKTFSASEKRNLTTIHDMDPDILDGNLSSDFENYASDQIVGRNLFIQLSTTWKRLLGNHELKKVMSAELRYSLIPKIPLSFTICILELRPIGVLK